jgi:hypothetical protein
MELHHHPVLFQGDAGLIRAVIYDELRGHLGFADPLWRLFGRSLNPSLTTGPNIPIKSKT